MAMPRISIHTPGVVDQEPPTRKLTRTSFIPIGAVTVRTEAVQLDHRIEVDADGNSIDHTVVTAALCFGCGRQFASNDDVGGACSSCGFLEDEACLTKFRCAVCEMSSCPRCSEKQEGQRICKRCKSKGRRIEARGSSIGSWGGGREEDWVEGPDR